MHAPRTVVVESAADVRAAMDAGGSPALVTVPGAAGYAGPLFLRAMMEAGGAWDQQDIIAVIDCGDDPGIVQRALDVGWRHILFTGRKDIHDKLATIARQCAATVLGPQDLA